MSAFANYGRIPCFHEYTSTNSAKAWRQHKPLVITRGTRNSSTNCFIAHSTTSTLEAPAVLFADDVRVAQNSPHEAFPGPSLATARLLRPSVHLIASREQDSASLDLVNAAVTPSPVTRITPEKLVEVGRVLGLNAREAQELVHRQPLLLQLNVSQLQERIRSLVEALGASEEKVAVAVKLHPWVLALEAKDVRHRVRALAAAAQVPHSKMARLCVTAPSLLRRQPDALAARFKQLSELLAVPVASLVDSSAGFTQLLTIQLTKAERRVEGVATSLGVQHESAQALVAKHPRLLALSTRILRNKVKVLQSILDQHQQEVGMLVLRCPELLHMDMDRVRKVYERMQLYLERPAAFVYAMVCSKPRLLLLEPSQVRKRVMLLQQFAIYSRRWSHDLEALSAFNAASCLSESWATYQRLQYLLELGVAEQLSLTAVLMASDATFVGLHPGFKSWREQRGRLML